MFPRSERGGLTAERIMEKSHCWNNSSISTIVNHPQYNMRGPGWSVSSARETLDSVPTGQTEGKQGSKPSTRSCVSLNQSSCRTVEFLLCMHITAPGSRAGSQGVMNFQYWEWLRDIKAGIQKVINLILSFLLFPGFFPKTLTSSISPLKERNQSPPRLKWKPEPSLGVGWLALVCDKIQENLKNVNSLLHASFSPPHPGPWEAKSP